MGGEGDRGAEITALQAARINPKRRDKASKPKKGKGSRQREKKKTCNKEEDERKGEPKWPVKN